MFNNELLVLEVGMEIKVDLFIVGEDVDVIGILKGKGF